MSDESSLAIRAVWLHYAGALTQAAVAERLGITNLRAHRLIARAVADGVVKLSIDADIVECVDLERRLAAQYGLVDCEVAPDLGRTDFRSALSVLPAPTISGARSSEAYTA